MWFGIVNLTSVYLCVFIYKCVNVCIYARPYCVDMGTMVYRFASDGVWMCGLWYFVDGVGHGACVDGVDVEKWLRQVWSSVVL